MTLACEDAEFIQPALAFFLDLSNLLQGFVKVVTCISRPLPNKTKLKFNQDFELLDLSKLINGLNGKVVLCISRPLPNKTKLKFH